MVVAEHAAGALAGDDLVGGGGVVNRPPCQFKSYSDPNCSCELREFALRAYSGSQPQVRRLALKRAALNGDGERRRRA
jgi:hypothetical protein